MPPDPGKAPEERRRHGGRHAPDQQRQARRTVQHASRQGEHTVAGLREQQSHQRDQHVVAVEHRRAAREHLIDLGSVVATESKAGVPCQQRRHADVEHDESEDEVDRDEAQHDEETAAGHAAQAEQVADDEDPAHEQATLDGGGGDGKEQHRRRIDPPAVRGEREVGRDRTAQHDRQVGVDGERLAQRPRKRVMPDEHRERQRHHARIDGRPRPHQPHERDEDRAGLEHLGPSEPGEIVPLRQRVDDLELGPHRRPQIALLHGRPHQIADRLAQRQHAGEAVGHLDGDAQQQISEGDREDRGNAVRQDNPLARGRVHRRASIRRVTSAGSQPFTPSGARYVTRSRVPSAVPRHARYWRRPSPSMRFS